jgi:hypothetical protein
LGRKYSFGKYGRSSYDLQPDVIIVPPIDPTDPPYIENGPDPWPKPGDELWVAVEPSTSPCGRPEIWTPVTEPAWIN